MFKALLSELRHSFILMKWGWIPWMILYFMVSGTCSEVQLHQPPLLSATLGHDVIMPCNLSLSHDEKMMTTPVLYWYYNSTVKIVPITDEYKERAHILDNTSMLLKNVTWADSGNYRCKLSITLEKDKSFRKNGSGSLLIVYDTMFFNLTSHDDSQLQCEINVTRNPSIVLSIFHDGFTNDSLSDVPADTALPYNTLSETIPLKSRGTYECQLHLNEDLIMKSIFHWNPPVAREGGDVEKCSATGCEPLVLYPEPWFLYVALLLVPTIILLFVVIAMLKDRR